MQVKPVPNVFGLDDAQFKVSVDFYVEVGFYFGKNIFIVSSVAFLIPQSKVGVQGRPLLMGRGYKFKDGHQIRFNVPIGKIVFESLQGEVDLSDTAGVDEVVFVLFDQDSVGG
jgi:hypothetical protein